MSTLLIEHSDAARADLLSAVLVDLGYRLRLVRVHHGQPLPPDLDGIDAVISLGGPQDPDDDAQPWMSAELSFLRSAHERAMPVLGICLGSQLLARALGGSVERNPAGIEWGFHPVTLTPVGREDPVFAGQPWSGMQMHAHRWHVSKLPAAARLLASSARTKVQAWAAGLRTYAVQYHPECSRASLERWKLADVAEMSETGLSPERFASDLALHHPSVQRLAERFFRQIALLVMPTDRR